jgi:hypothetical protein
MPASSSATRAGRAAGLKRRRASAERAPGSVPAPVPLLDQLRDRLADPL